MNPLVFEWDDGKNTLNKRKHRSEEVIRIISARKATKLERADYTKRWKI
jgi:uncharacterized DUF497 family protein